MANLGGYVPVEGLKGPLSFTNFDALQLLPEGGSHRARVNALACI